jgi:hypothetical protein
MIAKKKYFYLNENFYLFDTFKEMFSLYNKISLKNIENEIIDESINKEN